MLSALPRGTGWRCRVSAAAALGPAGWAGVPGAGGGGAGGELGSGTRESPPTRQQEKSLGSTEDPAQPVNKQNYKQWDCLVIFTLLSSILTPNG